MVLGKLLKNGVNFRIINSNKDQKVVHHDRLSPVNYSGFENERQATNTTRNDSASSENEQSENSHSESDESS